MHGLDYDALIIGLISATFITFWLQNIDNLQKAASAVLFSALLSGFGSPVASVYLIATFPILKDASDALPALSAVIIGGTVTWGLPILINFVNHKWGKENV